MVCDDWDCPEGLHLKKKDVGMGGGGGGYLCSPCILCFAWTLPSPYLVSVVFGTAIPTSLIFENVFITCLYSFSLYNSTVTMLE